MAAQSSAKNEMFRLAPLATEDATNVRNTKKLAVTPPGPSKPREPTGEVKEMLLVNDGCHCSRAIVRGKATPNALLVPPKYCQ